MPKRALPPHRTPETRFVPTLPVFIAFVAQCAFSQEGTELDRHYPVTDPKNFTRVVATVGDVDITAQEFLISYEFGPAFTKRQKESRRRYLEFMVNEKLFALDARANGLQNSARVRNSLREIEGDMATEELFKDDVLGHIRVTAREIEEGLREERIHCSLQWLFASRLEEATALRSEMSAGTPFDSLFARQLRGGTKRGDRSMESTLFKLRCASPVLASVADTLKPRVASATVKGPDGYYILRISDGWNDESLSTTETQKLAEDARRGLIQEKSDSLSDRYVRRLMLEHNPVIVRRTFDRLQAWLGSLWVAPERYKGWDLAKRFGEGDDSLNVARIDRYGGDTLVTLAKGNISLRQMLSWYRMRDTYFHLNTATPQAFFISVEDLVWRMVRDKLLVDRALRRNLQERDPVKKQLKWWEDKVLFGEEKLLLGSSIVLSDSAFRAFYSANARDYRSDSVSVQPFERVRDQVRKDYYMFELKKKMLHRIIALKGKYRVVVMQDVLAGLPVDVEDNPKAIDVYTAKRGGTFPHPAFPVIDLEWQTWM